jgi:chromosomal replication initiator protein
MVQESLRHELGQAAFDNWIRPIVFSPADGHRLRLIAPTTLARKWIESHYTDRIRFFARRVNPALTDITIDVGESHPKTTANDAKPQGAEGPLASASVAAPMPSASADLSRFSIQLDPRLTFDSFVVGKSNELAFSAARRIADADAVTFNPLFLYGGVGLGKTHLMHAIAWHIAEKTPQRRVVYLSAEKFMYEFVRAIRFKDTMAFKEMFRSVDVLMIDDVQFISDKNSTQEEFFHTFNALIDQNRQVIISADKSPSDLEGVHERLKSRLAWGLVADIHPTSYELRLGILQNKAASMGLPIPQDVIAFLAESITSNVRELEGALNRITAHADITAAPITIENTRIQLRDMLRSQAKPITLESLTKTVAAHYRLTLQDILASTRLRTIARPRQVAMFMAKELTPLSLPEIGKYYGGKDHTTVMYAVRKIRQIMDHDPDFAGDMQTLRQKILG